MRLLNGLGAACLAFCLWTAPSFAQTASAEGNFSFNYFSVEGFEISDTYTIDASFAERNGIEVLAPFRIAVPRRDQIDVNPILPDGGGVVAIMFRLPTTDGSEGVFLENIQFGNATIPLVPDAEDPLAARMAIAARLLEGDVFAMVSNGYTAPEMLALERVVDPPVPGAVHMISTFRDPRDGMRLLSRVTILPHPDQASSYLVTSLINLDMVPATDLPTLIASMSGRVLASFEYLPQ